MSKRPYAYRTMKWRWIYIGMAVVGIVFVVVGILLIRSGGASLAVVPFLPMITLFFGWQFGFLSGLKQCEDWDKELDSKETEDGNDER